MTSLGIVDLTGSSPAASPQKTAAKPPQQPVQPTETAKVQRLLEREINALTHKRLKEVVFTALRDSPDVTDVSQNLLLVPESDVVVEGDESEDGDEDGKDESEGTPTPMGSIRAIPSHKRSLSAYTDIPTQPHKKKPSTAEIS